MWTRLPRLRGGVARHLAIALVTTPSSLDDPAALATWVRLLTDLPIVGLTTCRFTEAHIWIGASNLYASRKGGMAFRADEPPPDRLVGATSETRPCERFEVYRLRYLTFVVPAPAVTDGTSHSHHCPTGTPPIMVLAIEVARGGHLRLPGSHIDARRTSTGCALVEIPRATCLWLPLLESASTVAAVLCTTGRIAKAEGLRARLAKPFFAFAQVDAPDPAGTEHGKTGRLMIMIICRDRSHHRNQLVGLRTLTRFSQRTLHIDAAPLCPRLSSPVYSRLAHCGEPALIFTVLTAVKTSRSDNLVRVAAVRTNTRTLGQIHASLAVRLIVTRGMEGSLTTPT